MNLVTIFLLSGCFVGSFADVVNIQKCQGDSRGKLPHFVDIEGCQRGKPCQLFYGNPFTITYTYKQDWRYVTFQRSVDYKLTDGGVKRVDVSKESISRLQDENVKVSLKIPTIPIPPSVKYETNLTVHIFDDRFLELICAEIPVQMFVPIN